MQLNRGMVDIEALAGGVRLVAEVSEKMDEKTASQKLSKDGELGWTATVALPRGEFLVEQQNVTIWTDRRPKVSAGDLVRFEGLAVGAYSQGASALPYLWATGVAEVETLDAEMESLLGKDD